MRGERDKKAPLSTQRLPLCLSINANESLILYGGPGISWLATKNHARSGRLTPPAFVCLSFFYGSQPNNSHPGGAALSRHHVLPQLSGSYNATLPPFSPNALNSRSPPLLLPAANSYPQKLFYFIFFFPSDLHMVPFSASWKTSPFYLLAGMNHTTSQRHTQNSAKVSKIKTRKKLTKKWAVAVINYQNSEPHKPLKVVMSQHLTPHHSPSAQSDDRPNKKNDCTKK